MNESISALLDGECTPSELERLLDEMERDPALREQFSRQCLARDSRMGTRIRSAQLDFSSKVFAALHDERPGAVVVPFASRMRRVAWRPLAGLAAAAAVGALAVLAVKPQAEVTPPTGLATASTAAVSPSAIVPVSAQAIDPALAASDDEATRQQLRNYMRAYSQSRDQQNVRSMLGYARYAAYTDDDRTVHAPGAGPQR